LKRTIAEPLRLDILAFELMGKTTDGALEALLAANPGMAANGPFLAAGSEVEIPPTPETPRVAAVNPWT